ncbi:conserved phage C-terminal domain-containing protein [Lactobacillus delbrueckii subsp. bulgaricus]|nr:hypothetical protein [Lactobacillus delbrueckii subsp. bulgaricus]
MTDFRGSSYFVMIPVEVSHNKKLLERPKAIILFGEIYTMLNATGSFYMSNNTLCERLACKPTAMKGYLNLLEEEGYIKRSVVYDEKTKRIKGREITLGDALGRGNDQGRSNDQGRVAQTAGVGSPERPGEGRSDDHKYISIRDQKNISVKDTGQAGSLPEEKIPYKKILDYLNEKTGKHYRNVPTNQELIRSRWNEGYTFDDFKKVIDNKVADWKGTGVTFSNGQLAENYLQPSTLFSRKFDKYLNQTVNSTDNVPEEYQGLFDQQPDIETGELPF